MSLSHAYTHTLDNFKKLIMIIDFITYKKWDNLRKSQIENKVFVAKLITMDVSHFKIS